MHKTAKNIHIEVKLTDVEETTQVIFFECFMMIIDEKMSNCENLESTLSLLTSSQRNKSI